VDRISGVGVRDGSPCFSGLAVLVPTHRHADVAGEVILELPHLAGNLLHDAHTAILMREHGIRRICTRDTDFNQFAFFIDPLRS
jgi:predicted nucleic acid-binding protein